MFNVETGVTRFEGREVRGREKFPENWLWRGDWLLKKSARGLRKRGNTKYF